MISPALPSFLMTSLSFPHCHLNIFSHVIEMFLIFHMWSNFWIISWTFWILWDFGSCLNLWIIMLIVVFLKQAISTVGFRLEAVTSRLQWQCLPCSLCIAPTDSLGPGLSLSTVLRAFGMLLWPDPHMQGLEGRSGVYNNATKSWAPPLHSSWYLLPGPPFFGLLTRKLGLWLPPHSHHTLPMTTPLSRAKRQERGHMKATMVFSPASWDHSISPCKGVPSLSVGCFPSCWLPACQIAWGGSK